MSYFDISYVKSDASFSTPDDSIFNPNQYKFYTQVNNSLNSLNTPINEDLKQIKINTYYYKRYKSENQILYFVMFIITIIIILSLIKKFFPFFDEISYSVVVAIILGISLLYIIYSIYLLMNKDNHNYDEDDYMFNSNAFNIQNNSNDSNTDCLQHDVYQINDISYNIFDLMKF